VKNRLTDLNDILFAQLERLTDESLTSEALAQEISRTTSVVQVADRIVDTASLQLSGAKLIAEHGAAMLKALPSTMVLSAGASARTGAAFTILPTSCCSSRLGAICPAARSTRRSSRRSDAPT